MKQTKFSQSRTTDNHIGRPAPIAHRGAEFFHTKAEFVAAYGGSGLSGRPVKLNSDGYVDSSLVSVSGIGSGLSGYSGYSGFSGHSGSGISGYSGSGISGYSGSGISGYSGSGISGYSGSGISGWSGSGISGWSGSGISGYSGWSGRSGWSGWSGISGWSGSGISGYSGWSGPGGGASGYSGSGISGYSGSGISGYSGYSGVVGGASDIVFNAGKGVDFSANTHAAGMTSEKLIWYEEGTWTPVDVSGASPALSFTIGGTSLYVRIGSLVWVTAQVTFPATSDANPAKIGGLPFTAADNVGNRGAGSITYAGVPSLTPIVQPAGTYMIIWLSGTGGRSNVQLSGLTIILSIMYRV